jgi:hypothetical protein
MQHPHGPGPEERKLRNRLFFAVFGFWRDAVLRERLASVTTDPTLIDRVIRDAGLKR